MRESPPPTAAQISPDPSPATGSKSQTLTQALKSASDATGIAFDYLLAQASQESGMNPKADNPHSSAAGLFQFTQSTWLDVIHHHGAAAGLGRYAKAITRGSDGKLTVTDPAIKAHLLELRHDPKIAARMAAEYAKDNQRFLEDRLGRPASSHDLYLAHFLGAAGAAKILDRKDGNSKRSAAGLLPGAAQSNPDLFQDPQSHKPRTVAGLYKAVQAHYNRALAKVAHMAPAPKAQEPAAPVAVTVAPKVEKVEVALTPVLAPRPVSPFFPVEIPPDPNRDTNKG